MDTITSLKSALDKAQKEAQKRLSILKAQRDKVQAQIDALEGKNTSKTKKIPKIAKISSKTQKRVKNGISLSHIIENYLSDGSSHSVKDIVTAVEGSDYKTNSASLYSCVAAVLTAGKFDRVSRGVYSFKKAETVINPAMGETIVHTPNEPVAVENATTIEPVQVAEPIIANEPN